MHPTARLAHLGLSLPTPNTPVGSYLPAKVVGDLVFTSGVVPFKEGQLLFTGRVPDQVTPEDAAECARQCALNILGNLATVVDLGEIEIIRINGYVASSPNFTGHPGVLNGASDLLAEVLGDRGRHTRVAVGVAALPLGAPVEIDCMARIVGPD
ncbi:MAG TPA: RidA family protein [bacterium]|nr:RidA family protein [bacterium]